MPAFAYIILTVGWVLWFLPFPIAGWNRNSPQKRDPRARWGLLLQGLAYAIVWQGHFWTRYLPTWRIALSILFLANPNGYLNGGTVPESVSVAHTALGFCASSGGFCGP